MTNRSDNFNRANTTSNIGTPSDGGSAYTVLDGVCGISSNQGYTSNPPSQGDSEWVLESGDSNVLVQATIAVYAANAGIIARVLDSANHIALISSASNSLELYKKIAFNFTLLGTATVAMVNGDVIALRAIDDQLSVYLNSVLQFTVTESFNQTYTKHGMRSVSTTVRFDDFSITSVVGTVRAIVHYRDTAGTGGVNAQKLVYRVTYFGDDVPEVIARAQQIEIELDLATNLSASSVEEAIIAAVQAKAVTLGLGTVFESDILIV